MKFSYTHRLSLASDRLFEVAARYSVSLIGFLLRKRGLILALALTGIYLLPGLLGNSRNAGYLYTGDNLGLYWPYLAKGP